MAGNSGAKWLVVFAVGVAAGALGAILARPESPAPIHIPPPAPAPAPVSPSTTSAPPGDPGDPVPVEVKAAGAVTLRNGLAGTVVAWTRPGTEPRHVAFVADGSLGPLPLAAGDYEFTVSRPGFETLLETVSVAAGAAVDVDTSLAEKDGALTVASDPPGAAVECDERALGTAPLAGVSVPAGIHQLRLSHPDADDLVQEVEIRGEALKDLGTLRLPPLAVLDLSALAPGVRATLDGEPASGRVKHRAGPVTLVFSREGFRDQRVEVTLHAGKPTVLAAVTFDSVPGFLDLSAVPVDVAIFVNGREVPRGPVSKIEVTPGRVVLGFDGPGLGTVGRAELEVRPGFTTDVPAPSFKPRALKPAVAGLAAPPRQDRRGAALPAGVVESGGRLLSVRDGAEMAIVPAGEFSMGTEDASDAERPIHKVQISAFLMDRHEVTNAQFLEFATATGYVTGAESDGWAYDNEGKKAGGVDWRHPDGPASSLAERDALPVCFVNWNDARAYAAWAGKRLPTEAEFERALRGGAEGKKYPWGDDLPPKARVANLQDETAHATYPKWKTWVKGYKDGFTGPAPAGSFPPNPFGLFDLSGNVSEWCNDGYDAAYYASSPKADPPGANPVKCRYRVHRGGSCYTERQNVHSANRGYHSPATAYPSVGFRCVVDLPPAAAPPPSKEK